MTAVVLDTNVFVSAMLGGVSGPLIDHWRAGRFRLIVTSEIVSEYFHVLRRPKFALPTDVVDGILAYVFHKAEFVTPSQRVRAIKADPSDDKFLDAAIAASVDFIVTGDRHLLSLGSYRHIPIITVRQFLDRLEEEAP